MMDRTILKRTGQSSLNEIISKIHELFDDYNSTSYQVRLSSLKTSFKQIVETQNLDSEDQVLKSCQKFGEVYGILIITSEIFYLFSVLYKNFSNLLKAKELAEKSVFFIENSKNFNKMLPKFLLNLSSILSCESFHNKSLKLLKKSKKILKSQMDPNDPPPDLKELYCVNLYNIAAEEEFLKDLQKAEKDYKKALNFINSFKPETSQMLISNISNGLERVIRVNSSNTANEMNFLEDFQPRFRSFAIGRTTEKERKIYSRKCRPLSGDFRSYSNKRAFQIKNKNSQRFRKFNQDPFHQAISSKIFGSAPEKKSQSSTDSAEAEIVKDYIEPQKSSNTKTVPQNPSLSISDTMSMFLAPEAKDSEDFGDSVSIDPNRFSIESSTKRISNYFQETFKRAITLSIEKDEDLDKVHETVQKPPKKNYLMIENLQIDFKTYQTFYSMNETLNSLEIRCVLDDNEYTLDIPIPAGTSVFEYIENKVKPGLSLKDKRLFIDNPEERIYAQGEIRSKIKNYQISITRILPRWYLRVKVSIYQAVFHIQDILNLVKPEYSELILNNPNFLISFFTLNQNGIVPRAPQPFPLDSLFKEKVMFDSLKKEVEIEICQFRFINFSEDSFSQVFFIQGIGPELKLLPLLVESVFLSKKLMRKKPMTLEESIRVLKKTIIVGNDLQIRVNKRHILFKSIMDPKIEKIKKSYLISNRNRRVSTISPVKSDFQILNPSLDVYKMNSSEINYQLNSKSEIIVDDSKKLFLAGQYINKELFDDDKILMRFSVYQFGQIFQIYMKYVEKNILSLIVCKGIAEGDIKKFTVDIKDIAKRINIPESHIMALGSFIVRNLLVIKSIDICYIDLEVSMTSPLDSLHKFSGLIRRFIAKRASKKRLENLVSKRKVKLKDVVYTALVYINNLTLYLRLVKPPEWTEKGYSYKKVEVLSVDMNYQVLIKQGHFPSVEKFFDNFKDLGISIEYIDNKKTLKCDPRFSIKS